jgi:predicted metalloprotease
VSDEVVASSEDPNRDHGSPVNHVHWTGVGFKAASPAACNTYSAASSLVG